MLRRWSVFPRTSQCVSAASLVGFANLLRHHHLTSLNFFATAVTSADALSQATCFSSTPQLLDARSRYHSSVNSRKKSNNKKIGADRHSTLPKQRKRHRSTPAASATTSTTSTLQQQQQRVPCGFSRERLTSLIGSTDTNYEVFFFNRKNARGDIAMFAAIHNVPNDDPFDRCISCGCTIVEHLTQEELDARFHVQLQEEKQQRREQREQEDKKQRYEALKQEVIAMIKEHNGESLHWGPTAEDFSKNHGLPVNVGRSEQFQQVLDLLRHVRRAPSPAERPAIVLFGSREQGKSRFLVELARSLAAFLALSGDGNASLQDARILHCDCARRLSLSDKLTKNEAEQEVAIRLLCAAAGTYVECPDCIECLVRIHQMTIEQAVQFLRDTGTIKAGSPTLFFLDWLTSILWRIPDPQHRLDFFKALHSALVTNSTVHSAVILTCNATREITQCAAAAAAVGHRTEFIEMALVRTLQDRRSMLVLHAALIRCAIRPQSKSSNDNEESNTTGQLPRAQDAADVLYFAELLKFSPGVMAHIVNDLTNRFDRFFERSSVPDCISCCGHRLWMKHRGRSLMDVLAIVSADRKLLTESAAAANVIDKADSSPVYPLTVSRSVTADARPVSVVVEPRWLEVATRSGPAGYFDVLKRFARNYVAAPTAEAAAEMRAAAIRASVLSGLQVQSELRHRLAQLLPEEPLATKQVRHLDEWLDCAPLLVAGMRLPSTVEFSADKLFDAAAHDFNKAKWRRDGALSSEEDIESDIANGTFPGPNRCSSNELVDIVFHIAVAGTDRKRLIQFWVQIDSTTNHPILQQPTSPYSDDIEQQQKTTELIQRQLFETENGETPDFVKEVHLGLSDETLQHPNCIVDHVVHIILTPVQVEQDGTKIVKKSVDARLGRLKSYSLYVVNPGTAGFENLLSQPVALTMPLMDSHDVDSWMEPVPHDVSKWKDYIGVKRGLSASIRHDKERAVYEKLVADNERQLKEWERQYLKAW